MQPQSEYIDRGHDQRYSDSAGTLGYVPIGDFRDVIIVPPLANITVSNVICYVFWF